MEIWKRYKNTMYDVSNMGGVRSNKMNKQTILIPQLSKKKYYRVGIDGRKQFIHRLVAETFLPLIEGKAHVNHKNCDKLDNHIDNLEWCTVYENNEHAQKNGLGSISKKCIAIKMDNEIIGEYDSYNSAYRKLKGCSDYVLIRADNFTGEERAKAIHKKLYRTYSKRPVLENRLLNEDAVKLIKELAKNKEYYPARIGRIFRVDKSIVSAILKGRIYIDVI